MDTDLDTNALATWRHVLRLVARRAASERFLHGQRVGVMLDGSWRTS